MRERGKGRRGIEMEGGDIGREVWRERRRFVEGKG